MSHIKHTLQISASLVGLTLLIVFSAHWLGFIPSEYESRIRERISLSEALAVQFSAAIQEKNTAVITTTLNGVVSRNTDIIHAALKHADGTIVASKGESTQNNAGNVSSANFMLVPIFHDNEAWGWLEVSFKPLEYYSLAGLMSTELLKLTAFIIVFGFVLYLLLVRKILTHLDPYKVVPARVRAALNTVSDGMVFIDNDGYIVLANIAIEKRLNCKGSQLIGRKLSSFSWEYTAKQSNNTLLPWEATLSQGKIQPQITLKYKTSANSDLIFLVNCTPIINHGDRVCGALASFKDVTELERMSYELENMTKYLRHEMSNALVGATGTVNLLEKGEHLSDDGKHLVNRAKRLHNVIRLLLGSVKEAKSIEDSFTNESTGPIRLDKIVKDVVDNYSAIYTDNIFIYKSDGQPLVIRGLEERIIQMLDKLTANAIDHADTGSVIQFSCYRDKIKAVLTVSNQGLPLPENKDAIFELFSSFRTVNVEKQNQGIGLYVVRLIAHAYGGTVVARNRKDVTGAEFIIELPLLPK